MIIVFGSPCHNVFFSQALKSREGFRHSLASLASFCICGLFFVCFSVVLTQARSLYMANRAFFKFRCG